MGAMEEIFMMVLAGKLPSEKNPAYSTLELYEKTPILLI